MVACGLAWTVQNFPALGEGCKEATHPQARAPMRPSVPAAVPAPAVGKGSAPGPGPSCAAAIQAGGDDPQALLTRCGVDFPQGYTVRAGSRLNIHHELTLTPAAEQGHACPCGLRV